MRGYLASACTAVILLAVTAEAANVVVVESKVVSLSASNVTVGIYVENDAELMAMVYPLAIRAVSDGSFITDTLYVQRANRLSSYLTGYSVTGVLPEEDNEAQRRCNGGGFSTRGQPDFISPEALLFAATQGYSDSCFPMGDDGSPPAGSPSLRIGFGVSSAMGTFEIDTTCVTPNNHLAFVDPDVNLIVPEFTKGVIEIGGPFYQADSISGHIDSDVAINHDVVVTGDLTVDSGVTLTIARGTELMATPYLDVEEGGLDADRVEIIVHGTLAIDETDGERPVFTGPTAYAGAWYGIRIMPGGHFNTGIGAIIDNAEYGISIDRSAPADTLSALVVQNCNSVGINSASSSVALIQDTVRLVSSGFGLIVDSASPKITECVIESCGAGIQFRYSSSVVRNSRIVGPGSYGILFDNSDLQGLGRPVGSREPQIAGITAEEPAFHATLVEDTVSGYFGFAQLSMFYSGGKCTIDSCGFIHLSGERSPYGLYLGMTDEVTMHRSSVTGFTNTGVYSFRAKVNLGVSPSNLGYNNISADSSGCQGCTLRRVYHSGTDTIRVEGNWWGADPPSSAWFSGKVDYTPWLEDPPQGQSYAQGALLDDEIREVGTEARGFLTMGNYPNPFNGAMTISFAIAEPSHVEVIVYNVLGQTVKRLINADLPDGQHHVTWNGTNEIGGDVASGVYLYRIVAGDVTQTRKMVLLK